MKGGGNRNGQIAGMFGEIGVAGTTVVVIGGAGMVIAIVDFIHPAKSETLV